MPLSNTGISPAKAREIYARRFDGQEAYRHAVWRVLVEDFFQQYVRHHDTVIDLGAGYCEFINQINAARKYAIDMNPATVDHAQAEVTVLNFDVSREWPLPAEMADIVFTSNFFEHLQSKESLRSCLRQIHRSLKAGGRLLALGPNIRFCANQYWDFIDHFVPISDRSLVELLVSEGFSLLRVEPRFLPYTMSRGPRPPVRFLKLYLKCSLAWPLFGKQFFVVAQKLA